MKKTTFIISVGIGISALLLGSCSIVGVNIPGTQNNSTNSDNFSRRGMRGGSGSFMRGEGFGSGAMMGSGQIRFGSGARNIKRLDIPEEARTILGEIRKARTDRNFEKVKELENSLQEKFPNVFPKRGENIPGSNMGQPRENMGNPPDIGNSQGQTNN